MKDKQYFNDLAHKWDEICTHPEEKIRYVMDKINIHKGNSVLDLGSGTGVILPYIEEKIGPNGKITALDFAENMIKISKEKYKDLYKNINFVVNDFYQFKTEISYDYVIAYSCYPHFKDKKAFFKKVNGLLSNNGKFVIAHIESKEKINSIHNGIESSINSDKLQPIHMLEDLVKSHGFEVIYSEDSQDYYILVCNK
ncbi:demethylmenaquinone methyltransferase [Clostridium tepidiprofundi DSM 19306]|uniref:Demethylmenaquinone methyltransferase n=1 Tax=Clostridium tepidiprofundi DSM 19306 TaxID=1121338 RepID=A0A151B4J2_9CLOT|nr:class I SAM-dependent methyltransferase [Clostridium tepidiprofundi]KYH34682.1 demethylmenaquinone methyltransferase [Clostridium tepidiprofundi DSM 19306]